ncbi:hypothetical protein ES703_100598 [subsurface metagenome]
MKDVGARIFFFLCFIVMWIVYAYLLGFMKDMPIWTVGGIIGVLGLIGLAILFFIASVICWAIIFD